MLMRSEKVDKKLIVGFDMDGVILDNADSKIKIAKKFGLTIKLGHTPSEILKTLMPQVVWEEFQNILYDHLRFAFSNPLMRGTRTTLEELTKKKIPIFLISRRKIPEIAIKILKRHSLWPKYFNDMNSFFVSHPKDKDTTASKLGVTHYIDDELKIINALASVPNKFLFDPVNAFKKADYYTKIRSWSEFKKHIKLS